jgi:large subunit ribosomal protein L4
MIDITVHNQAGKEVGTIQVDEQTLGGEVRPGLLKQAYVRFHANRRQGSARTKSRADTAYSTRKLYKQKGTGNARRGPAGTNIMRHGGHGFAKRPHSWRQDMPAKMRRLANRNAVLAKAIDGEIKIVDKLDYNKPNTKSFQDLLGALKIDRTCLVALPSVSGHEASSARNLEHVNVTQIDRLNAFDLLNHRYLLVDKEAFEAYLGRLTCDELAKAKQEASK